MGGTDSEEHVEADITLVTSSLGNGKMYRLVHSQIAVFVFNIYQ